MVGIAAILLRQSSSEVATKRPLVVFVFACIIFTYGYEGVISSLIIVRPPFFVFDSMKELLDNGYKIFGLTENGLTKFLTPIFKREEIPLENMLSYIDSSQSQTSMVNYFFHFNVTLPMTPDQSPEGAKALYSMARRIPGGSARCHSIRTVGYMENNIYTFFGDSHLQVLKITQQLQESGILSKYHDVKYDSLSLYDWRITAILEPVRRR